MKTRVSWPFVNLNYFVALKGPVLDRLWLSPTLDPKDLPRVALPQAVPPDATGRGAHEDLVPAETHAPHPVVLWFWSTKMTKK